MKIHPLRHGLGIGIAGLVALAALPLHADVVILYDGEGADFTADLAAFDAAQDLGDGILDSVENVPAPTAFGTGDALRLFDNNPSDKPELQGELASALTGPFRIDFLSLDQSTNASSSAIRWRMGNSGASISSENNVAFSLSWQADGELTAKYSNAADGVGDVDTLSSIALIGVQDITLIGNAAVADTYAYSLFGETRVLDPLAYDVYINGVLLNTSAATGLAFHEDKTGTTFDPNAGLQRFGLIGSSNSNVDPDVMYDNIILRTGTDIIPEPSSLALLGLAAGIFAIARRRRG